MISSKLILSTKILLPKGKSEIHSATFRIFGLTILMKLNMQDGEWLPIKSHIPTHPATNITLFHATFSLPSTPISPMLDCPSSLTLPKNCLSSLSAHSESKSPLTMTIRTSFCSSINPLMKIPGSWLPQPDYLVTAEATSATTSLKILVLLTVGSNPAIHYYRSIDHFRLSTMISSAHFKLHSISDLSLVPPVTLRLKKKSLLLFIRSLPKFSAGTQFALRRHSACTQPAP